MKNWIHFLGGSVTVYLAMAACSAGSKHGSRTRSSDAGMAAMSDGGASSQAAGGAEAVANAGTSAVDNPSGGESAAAGGLGGMIGEMMDPVEEADAAAATSGTRLRARYYIGDDGSKQFVGWHDNMRGEDCSFWKAPDGALRCTPFYATTPPSMFADAACSEPVTVALKTSGSACGVAAPPAKYAYLSDACGAGRQRYTVGTQPTGGAVFTKSGTNCTDVTASIAASYDVFSLTSPTPAPDSAFVAATEQVE